MVCPTDISMRAVSVSVVIILTARSRNNYDQTSGHLNVEQQQQKNGFKFIISLRVGIRESSDELEIGKCQFEAKSTQQRSAKSITAADDSHFGHGPLMTIHPNEHHILISFSIQTFSVEWSACLSIRLFAINVRRTSLLLSDRHYYRKMKIFMPKIQ